MQRLLKPYLFIAQQIGFVLALSLAFFLSGVGLAQDNTQTPPAIQTGAESTGADFKREIEPGIVVIGRSNRFAELGNCQSFDVCPDGRTIVGAGAKLQFFDLQENRLGEEIGEQGDYYQKVQYSPDGRFLVAYTYANSGSTVRVWDAIDLSLVNTIKATEGVADTESFKNFYIQNMLVSPDNSFVALSSNNAMVLRDLKTGELVLEFPELNFIQQMGFSPDETQLYLPKSGRMEVFDIESGQPVSRSESPVVNVLSQATAVNLARKFAAFVRGANITIKNLEGGNDRVLSLPAGSYAQTCQFSDDGSRIAVSAWTNTNSNNRMEVFVMDVDSGKTIKRIGNVGQNISGLRFTTDGSKLLLTGYGLFGVNEFDLQSNSTEADEQVLTSPAAFCRVHPDKESFVSFCQSGEICFFDLKTGEIRDRVAYQGGPNGMALSADGSRVVVYGNSWQGVFSEFSFKSAKKRKDYRIKADGNSAIDQIRSIMSTGTIASISSNAYPNYITYSEDESELYGVAMVMTFRSSGSALAGFDSEQSYSIKLVRLDAEKGTTLGSRTFPLSRFGMNENQWVQVAAISKDAKRLAVGNGNKVNVVDIDSGETAYVIDGASQMRSIHFSPDNRFLVTSSHGPSCQVWDQETGELVTELNSELGNVTTAFTADGERMLVCSESKAGKVELYNTNTWEPVFQRSGTQGNRISASVSDDGQMIVFGLDDCRIEIWDLAQLK